MIMLCGSFKALDHFKKGFKALHVNHEKLRSFECDAWVLKIVLTENVY